MDRGASSREEAPLPGKSGMHEMIAAAWLGFCSCVSRVIAS